jgi:hypothetical protein
MKMISPAKVAVLALAPWVINNDFSNGRESAVNSVLDGSTYPGSSLCKNKISY